MSRKEQMSLLITEYHNSGLSLKSFCEQKQIKRPTFHYWCKKLKEQEQGAFVPIRQAVASAEHNGVELIYPGGVRIRLDHFDLNQIHQLLQLS
ncbi:IS66 family insertion sequence element accessory protein TnpA [Arachidicoccus soli]|uniref:IS66 family insertion sequence element accessory protein TnpB n=1 Tax=Arachidicoccus soli TaxID=2341117 RepID=A0A386HQ39_9BACT|nr:hypothetical protein [Arachidicoccus soli]AYD47374.1 IS66 family insertion sequence hypothetical protein [Arachidicoccus soli]